jgi:uncharacterized membrane protein YkgB
MIIEMELNESQTPARIEAFGEFLLRYGLVLVLCGIGAMKFTAYEAEGIKSLIKRVQS